MKTIAERIEGSGLSDKEISERVSAGRVTVWRWRRGLKKPVERGHLQKLAGLLGCTTADLRPDWAAALSDDAP